MEIENFKSLEDQIWERCVKQNDQDAFYRYLGQFPNGEYVKIARAKILELTSRPLHNDTLERNHIRQNIGMDSELKKGRGESMGHPTRHTGKGNPSILNSYINDSALAQKVETANPISKYLSPLIFLATLMIIGLAIFFFKRLIPPNQIANVPKINASPAIVDSSEVTIEQKTMTSVPISAKVGDEKEKNKEKPGKRQQDTKQPKSVPMPDTLVKVDSSEISEKGATDMFRFKTIEDSNKTWVAENLDLEFDLESWCYDSEKSNCSQFGRLYTWEAAKKACKQLGDEWRLPSDGDWKTLALSFGGYYDEVNGDQGDPQKAYNALTKNGPSNFNALLGGYRYPGGDFDALMERGIYWSSLSIGNGEALVYDFSSGGELYRYKGKKSNGYSCRCVKDNPQIDQ